MRAPRLRRHPLARVLSALLAAVVPATAARAQAPAAPALGERVARAVADRWGVGAADVRLEWLTPAPNAPLLPGDSVACEETGRDGRWFVRLPGSGSSTPLLVRAGVVRSLPTALRALPRGHVLAPADIVTRPMVTWGAPRDAATSVVGAGWITRRILAAGEPLRAPAVDPPPATRAGDTIRVELRRAGLTLVVPAVAGARAAVGQEVWVRTSTGVALRGTVSAPGIVRVE